MVAKSNANFVLLLSKICIYHLFFLSLYQQKKTTKQDKVMVYVIRKAFYNDNGIDRALAIGIGDITCFSSWKKAEDWVKETVNRDELAGNPKYEEWNEDVKMLFVDDIVKKAKTYAQREYNKGCECRFGYTIVQPIVW